jgi:hypothetical protein
MIGFHQPIIMSGSCGEIQLILTLQSLDFHVYGWRWEDNSHIALDIVDMGRGPHIKCVWFWSQGWYYHFHNLFWFWKGFKNIMKTKFARSHNVTFVSINKPKYKP